MFKTTCAECGDDCQVPFKPTGERPVYCSNCFRNIESDGGRDFERKEPRRDRDDGRRDRFDRSDSIEKRMYKAVCADCGTECEVPFKPNGERPVYCSNCFVTDDKNRDRPRKVDESKLEFERLNEKLDKIMKLLEAAGLKKENVVIKPIKKEVKEEIVEVIEEAPVKAAKKKVEKETPVKEKAEKKETKKKAK